MFDHFLFYHIGQDRTEEFRRIGHPDLLPAEGLLRRQVFYERFQFVSRKDDDAPPAFEALVPIAIRLGNVVRQKQGILRCGRKDVNIPAAKAVEQEDAVYGAINAITVCFVTDVRADHAQRDEPDIEDGAVKHRLHPPGRRRAFGDFRALEGKPADRLVNGAKNIPVAVQCPARAQHGEAHDGTDDQCEEDHARFGEQPLMDDRPVQKEIDDHGRAIRERHAPDRR